MVSESFRRIYPANTVKMEQGGTKMKHEAKGILYALLLGIIVPAGLYILCLPKIVETPAKEQIHITVAQPEAEPTKILVQEGTDITEMLLTDYIAGVILGEMPGSFSLEAKKAQAVVARTYALRVAAGRRHNGAVCTDSNCCQNYYDWQSVPYSDAVAQARTAAEQTAGMVLTYQGQLIDATYFSCSGGMTEAAVAVWGADIPYLQAVASPGEEYATHYTDTEVFTLGEFQTAMQLELPEDNSQWFGPVTYTDSGGVETMEIGGKLMRGTEIRKALGLRSTVFSVEIQGEAIVITTKGFGHRVGMSQFGADAMARAGNNFSEILHHYYQGVTLETNWQ